VYPRPFDYVQAESLEDALAALEGQADAKAIAGGQSLVPMMSLGLATPSRVVDIGKIDLAGIEIRNGSVVIGALTRHRELEHGSDAAANLPLAAEAARHVGNPRVRNRGTFGGSLSHADPAAEFGAVALAYGGRALIRGLEGERGVDFDDFFHGFFETAVQPGELMAAAELDRPPSGSGTGFFEIARRADDFALAAAAAVVTPSAAGGIERVRLALAGVADRPIRCLEAEEACHEQEFSDDLVERLSDAVERSIAPESDAFVSAEYRRRAAAVSAARAVRAAWRRTAN
jgi:aerobic carbon-monoxide dehydrogenase medium subunit